MGRPHSTLWGDRTYTENPNGRDSLGNTEVSLEEIGHGVESTGTGQSPMGGFCKPSGIIQAENLFTS
jgi:hypothetical protein